jgi:hypothetical protein
MNQTKKVKTDLSGYECIIRTLSNPHGMLPHVLNEQGTFYRLHDVLMSSYGLKSTNKMSSVCPLPYFNGSLEHHNQLDRRKFVFRGQSRRSIEI